jgi:prolyl-tRNA synthetase
MGRVEVNIGSLLGIGGEVEVEAATDDDLKKFPQLVKGYIGPGLTLDEKLLGAESATEIPYFLDPRVVDGTDWITGANEYGKHVYYLVAGRDFTADGVIEASEVREGDPAPDGSGPLQAARGIEMGHIFQLGRKYAEALGLKVLDQNGKLQTVTMGSYGVGVTRALAAIAEGNHDEKGLIWPRNLAPADVHVVITGKGEEIFSYGDELVAELEAQGLEVMVDDRPKTSPGVKFGDAELLGVPTIVVIGRGYKDGKLELKDRRNGEARDIEVAHAAAEIVAEVRG